MSIPEGVDRDSMMTQAQNIWTMLDEMSERDPQVYQGRIYTSLGILTNVNVSYVFWGIVLFKET